MVVTAIYRSGATYLYHSAPDSLQRALIGQYDYDPTVAEIIWTADSSAILLVDTYRSLVTRVIRVDVHTGTATVISEQDFVTRVAEWSPDGRYVVLRNDFFQPIEVRLIDVASRRTTAMPVLSEARLSPNGRYLAYQEAFESQSFHILNIDAGQTQSYTLENIADAGDYTLNMAWAADSQMIAFSYASALYQVDLATGNIALLVDIPAQVRSWSADGRRLLLDVIQDGRRFLAIYEPETGQQLHLDNLTVRVSAREAWSPNSNQLVLSDVSSNLVTINVVDVMTGAVQHQLTYSTQKYRPVYINDGAVVIFQKD
jgi:Tol biopolymer transport system component